MTKFENLILYICKQSESDPRFGATKLNKILWLSDFEFYRFHGRSISNESYQKLPKGPAPKRLLPVRKEMVVEKKLRIENRPFYGRTQDRPIALAEPDISGFDAEEIKIVDLIIEVLRNANGTEVSDLSHKMLEWWEDMPERQTIDFRSYLVRVPVEPTDEMYAHAEGLLTLARSCKR